MSYKYCSSNSIEDELTNFYHNNRAYLMFLYHSESDFIDEILKTDISNLTRYDIVFRNIEVSQYKITKEEEDQVKELKKEMIKTNDMKTYNRLNKEIKNLNKTIDKKRLFIKKLFSDLQV